MDDKSKKYVKTGRSYKNVKAVIKNYLNEGGLRAGQLIYDYSNNVCQVTAYGWIPGQPSDVYLAIQVERDTRHDGNGHLYSSNGEQLDDPSETTYFYASDEVSSVLDLIEIGYDNEEK